MNLSRKILVVHADPIARRRLTLLLVEAGYDVRPFGASEAALKAAHGEWFDLALIDYALPGGEGFGFAGHLREAQPTVPVIMLLPQLELPLIIQGIRLGLTDVLAAEADPRPVLRRVNALLRPGTPATPELTPAELAEVDAVLARYGEQENPGDAADVPPDATAALREQLAQAMRARIDLEAEVERLKIGKAAAEQELQALLEQQSQNVRVQAEIAELRLQRDQQAAAQATIDAQSRELDHTRAEIAVARQALEDEKRGDTTPPVAKAHDPLELERAHLAALREDLREEEERLREESARVRQEAAQLAQERRRWHEEIEQLREREDNLRAYEQRLREQQAQLEKERLAVSATRSAPPATSTAGSGGARERDAIDELIQRDVKLRAEWEKVHRANELLEAERAMFRDERMALRDLEQTIRQREQRLRELEAQVAAHEVIRRHLPPPPPPRLGQTESTEGRSGGVLKALTRAPFSIWGSKSGS